MKEVVFRISKQELQQFLDITKELVKIMENFKVLFLQDGILIYTILSEPNSNKINALKVFTFKWGKIFSDFPKDLYLSMTFMYGKNFNEKMKFLLDTEQEEIEIKINYNSELFVYSFSGSNEHLEVRSICENNNPIKDLTFPMIKEKMNSDYSEWSFEITNDQLSKVLKLSNMNSENELVTLKLENGVVSFYENDWDLKIGNIDSDKNGIWNFKKDYLKYILNEKTKDKLRFSIFSSYIVVDESKSYFMMSMDLID